MSTKPDRRVPHHFGRNKSPGGLRRILWFAVFYGISLVAFTGLVYALRLIVRG